MRLSQDDVAELRRTFTVDNEGFLVRISKVPGTRAKLGRVSIAHGYARPRWRGRTWQGHHIAWALYYGELPPDGVDVDHVNMVRHDNRKDNLRLCTRSQNMMNTRHHKDARVPVKGVDYKPNRGRLPYRARVCRNYKTRNLGWFATADEAAEAVRAFREVEASQFNREC